MEWILLALSEDQARSANSRGLRAVAINRDTLRTAYCEIPPRKLLDEVESGHWDLVIMSPEMLKSQAVHEKMKSIKFRDLLRFVGIDEFHLIHKHGDNFRPEYQAIGDFRACLSASVHWIAATATPPTGPSLIKESQRTTQL
ncbi:hypothetical protein NEOLEDRAFT_1180369 [Neolentinus lepideus HHB14362 ss-1]|uniref:DNA 3'-5' helicase n=1 Tax=Neolentinus lepideus HHB14362 ss-1 TaxID=1314782 RepID=A0A165R122_9AGAM|nr:hypothetical protein NEOLEDRAFT_1180369 [Neolentinus lepideus HHB14362 ss-1]